MNHLSSQLKRKEMITAKGKYDHRDYASSSSSSSSSPSPASASREHDVFLSFAGLDTRRNITSDLFQALKDRGILTYLDQDGLLLGNQMWQSLISAIHRSKIFIVIFSHGYAFSAWCLNELAQIAEFLQKGNRGEIIVLPVFCGVSPSDVRNQTGSFEIAFQHLQKSCDTETLEEWKKALRVVGELRGWYIQGFIENAPMIPGFNANPPLVNWGKSAGEFIPVIAETVFRDLGNIKLRSQTVYRETRGFSASCRGNTDFGWQTLNGISFRATYEVSRPFHIFINHRGPDTKGNIAALLYRDLTSLGLNSFLDKRSIMHGEELEMVIETAIRECKVGVAIISPDYCTSENCLHELAMLMECNKKLIPIFFDTKVSDLTIKSNGSFSDEQMDRFSSALKFIKKRAGIEFNSKEDWPDMIDRVLASVMNMINKDWEIKETDYHPPHELLC